ncbi:MAG: hypothetical protein RLZZ401_548 [Pseudomonadota bacterium]|jgi:alpha-beta hydrolase superfamily lysophospholipase
MSTAPLPRGLHVRNWPVLSGKAERGMVVLVHGLGEHIGRYERLAAKLNRWGFAVLGYDQYGHGRSEGARGALPHDARLTNDLASMLALARSRVPAATPVLVLGHSMGGLVASLAVAQLEIELDGLVLSSPALDPGLSSLQKLLVSVVPALAPDLRVGNGLNPNHISHDSAEVAAYMYDPLVHKYISARLARFIADKGTLVLGQAPHWRVPTLLMYAGADRLVNPAGSHRFSQAAPAEVVSSTCFDALYHEIFNELPAAQETVYAVLKRWLNQNFSPAPQEKRPNP